jgi:hypothetical protein
LAAFVTDNAATSLILPLVLWRTLIRFPWGPAGHGNSGRPRAGLPLGDQGP